MTGQQLFNKLTEMFPDADPNYIKTKIVGCSYDEETVDRMTEMLLSEKYPLRSPALASPSTEELPGGDPSDLGSTNLERRLATEQGQFLTCECCFDDEVLAKDVLTCSEGCLFCKNCIRRSTKIRFAAGQVNMPCLSGGCTKEFDLRLLEQALPSKLFTKLAAKKALAEVQAAEVQLFSKLTAMFTDADPNYIKTKIVGCTYDEETVNRMTEMLLSEKYPLRLPALASPPTEELAGGDPSDLGLTNLERMLAREQGQFLTCECCFDDEVLAKDVLTCSDGCLFCKNCIRRSTEINFAAGQVNMPCLAGGCTKEFDLRLLEQALPPKLFTKLTAKKALAEVQAAEVTDLETCPFCDFAYIPVPGDIIFHCLNSECMKESCRECNEPPHIPYRCNEVERDEAVAARTYIEDKMTEALIRKCWKCQAKFIKVDGCNNITCKCGASTCYVCGQSITDYRHFTRKPSLCPLYSKNSTLHDERVIQAATAAKRKVDPTKLVVDPTADLSKHFGKSAKRRKKNKH